MQEIHSHDEKVAAQPSRKKEYIAPKLTRHGKVEEMTQLIPNPGPSEANG